MTLSPAEKKFHDNVYRKIISESKERLSQRTCLNLFQRGIPNSDTCEKIWKACVSPGQDELAKKELSKALKYISALQNGYKFEDIAYEKLPGNDLSPILYGNNLLNALELPTPSLPKRQPKEVAKSESNDHRSQGMASVITILVCRLLIGMNKDGTLSMRSSGIVNDRSMLPNLLPNGNHEETKEPVVSNNSKRKKKQKEIKEEPLLLSTVEDLKVPTRKQDNEIPSGNEISAKESEEVKIEQTKYSELKNTQIDTNEQDPSKGKEAGVESQSKIEDHKPTDHENDDEKAQIPIKEEEKQSVMEDNKPEEHVNEQTASKKDNGEEVKQYPQVEETDPSASEEDQKSKTESKENATFQPEVKEQEEIKPKPAEEDTKLSEDLAKPLVSEEDTKNNVSLKENMNLKPLIVEQKPLESEQVKKTHTPQKEEIKLKPTEEEKLPFILPPEDDKHSSALNNSQISNGKMHDSERELTSSAYKVLQTKRSYHEYMLSRQKIRIEIVGSKEVTSGLLGISSYTLYTIRAKYEDAKEFVSDHRYSDFEWLDHYLRSQPRYKGLNIPILPEKKAFGNMNLAFVEQRKEGLEYYLKELGRHSVLHKDEILHKFFSTDSNAFEKIKDSIQLPSSFPISAADIINFSKTYEYISASIKAQIKEHQDESILEDVEKAGSVHERLHQLLTFVQEFIQSLESTEKRGEIYTSLSNGIIDIQQEAQEFESDEAIWKFEEFCTAISSYVSNKFFEVTRDENLLAGLKKLEDKILGLDNGHRVFIALVNDYKTNEELRNDKESKILRFLVEGRDTKKLDEEKIALDKTIEQQRKEIKLAIENLQTELNELEIVFDLIMNEEIDNYNSLQNNYWCKYYTTLKSENPLERKPIDIIEF